jgi:uncharacterized protein YndB with AHSA1/START domain
MPNQKIQSSVDKEKLQYTMTRVFDAPRELVYKALTDPKLVAQWWGPREVTTIVEKMDVRPGGTWRYIQRGADGNEYAFSGEYREVVPNERIVQTFEFEPMPGHITVDTYTLTDQDGKTLVTNFSQFASLQDLEGMVASGMEGGANESYDRLEELLSNLK